jgi:hypothetical protein
MVGLEDKFGVLIGYWDEEDVKSPATAPDFESGPKAH